MTEDEAEAIVCDHVPRETAARLRRYVDLMRGEAVHQNLVSTSTLDLVWQRHILDSAQVLPLAREAQDLWVDIGSGAGLPGIVVAILREAPAMLIEPRAKRAAFLQHVVDELGIADRTSIVAKTAASAPLRPAGVISARAVASLDALFAMGLRFATPETLWVLPKGRSAADELAAARPSWHGDFRLVPSQTDSSASIVVARGVRPKT
ncbi:16S rRNA (guanine527-N7)-methyltransferase [Sphingomonas vulcanisoli]|uniref:Ribosomal RNA small subunit methyltransferase G n=1 Tax=Sphingomonas vulcanisoli TaxID=1658060 RepID=A0ABX0TPP8_9SPHN|nr:16S rRNA (guanine(527)-N(7))-methyltransferase RsmG [Sphingomonas vulcanisoli]NIJ07401.1 16S rRNA (guanine527-N7)-methyltransferase [Sphingomonas vulcanisoli]